MIDLIQRGGVIFVIILLLSVVAAAIIIERLLYFRRIRGDEEMLLKRLQGALRKNHYEEALSICEANPMPITNLMRVGIEHRTYSTETIKGAITDAAAMETPSMERFLSALGTIAHISPLLGLLGTVTGNIQAFGVLGDMGAVGDPAVLAKGISEALITTAGGIIVSIPAIIFYNYLVNRVNHTIIRLENRVSELVLLLKGAEADPAGASDTDRPASDAGLEQPAVGRTVGSPTPRAGLAGRSSALSGSAAPTRRSPPPRLTERSGDSSAVRPSRTPSDRPSIGGENRPSTGGENRSTSRDDRSPDDPPKRGGE